MTAAPSQTSGLLGLFDTACDALTTPLKVISTALSGVMLLGYALNISALIGISLSPIGWAMIGLAVVNLGIGLRRKIRHGQKVSLLGDLVVPLTLMSGGTALAAMGWNEARWGLSLGLSAFAIGSWAISRDKTRTNTVSAIISAGWALIGGDALWTNGHGLHTFQENAYYAAAPAFEAITGMTMLEYVSWNTYATALEQFPELRDKTRLLIFDPDPARMLAAYDQALRELGVDPAKIPPQTREINILFLKILEANGAQFFDLKGPGNPGIILAHPSGYPAGPDDLIHQRMTILHELGHAQQYSVIGPEGFHVRPRSEAGDRLERYADAFGLVMFGKLYPELQGSLPNYLASRIMGENLIQHHPSVIENIILLHAAQNGELQSLDRNQMLAKIDEVMKLGDQGYAMLKYAGIGTFKGEDMSISMAKYVTEHYRGPKVDDETIWRAITASFWDISGNALTHGTPEEKALAAVVREAWIVHAAQSHDPQLIWAIELRYGVDIPGQGDYNPIVNPQQLADRMDAAFDRQRAEKGGKLPDNWRDVLGFISHLRSLDPHHAFRLCDLLTMKTPAVVPPVTPGIRPVPG